jgi:hypothetical protein
MTANAVLKDLTATSGQAGAVRDVEAVVGAGNPALVINSSTELCVKQKWICYALLIVLLFVSSFAHAQETVTDSALWSGGLVLFEYEDSLDYSVEYQLRLDDNMSSFSNHFVEFMGYKRVNENLLFNSGLRFTKRTDHAEGRLYFGGFLDLTRTEMGIRANPGQFRATLQIGYQHDFNTLVDDRFMGSNSIRWILVASKPATKKITPFLLGGVLTTWNDAYSFGIDKIRLGGGIVFHTTERGRLRTQYIWEEARFMMPKKRTNILWLRYEMILGQ